MYTVKKVIKEMGANPIFDYILINGFGIEVGKFHNERFALKVRDLLNNEESSSDE